MINIPSPIIDLEIVEKNIDKMMELCQKWQMNFRPHFKTHQSAKLAKIFKDKGIEKCTVSSVSMALYFAANGWKDITIAIPVNVLEIEGINILASSIKLNLLIDHLDTIKFLKENINHQVSVFIEVDTDYGRSGVFYKNTKTIDDILHIIQDSSLLEFEGFLSHTGHNYGAKSPEIGAEIFEQARKRMWKLKQDYRQTYPNLSISLGDTPSSSFADNFKSIDEWRPGNFIFFDMMQVNLGVCEFEDIALIIRCPIIGIYPKREEFVIYGGGVHLSKESLEFKGQKICGWLKYADNTNPSAGFPVISLSQEHGIISASKAYISKLKFGDLVDIIPVHSCMSADLYSSYTTTKGEMIMKFRSNN